MIRATLTLSALLLAFSPIALVQAQTPAEKGLEIAEKASERAPGYRDSTADGEMILRDRQGQESVRRFRSAALEVPDDGDKSLIVFQWPADIDGTALLTHAHTEAEDDQWLYLPALKRVRRISSANRSSSFVGSEFAYEDLVPSEIEKYTYLWLRDEPCPGVASLQCHVYERYPVDPSSGYKRQVIWRDAEFYRAIRIEYYDRKDSHLKTLTVEGYKQYEGGLWRPDRMHMQNHQTGKSTLLLWSDYRFATGLGDQDFTTRALERAR